jgi:hypothetical protein
MVGFTAKSLMSHRLFGRRFTAKSSRVPPVLDPNSMTLPVGFRREIPIRTECPEPRFTAKSRSNLNGWAEISP